MDADAEADADDMKQSLRRLLLLHPPPRHCHHQQWLSPFSAPIQYRHKYRWNSSSKIHRNDNVNDRAGGGRMLLSSPTSTSSSSSSSSTLQQLDSDNSDIFPIHILGSGSIGLLLVRSGIISTPMHTTILGYFRWFTFRKSRRGC
jgi:hypothetical protein